MSADPAKQRATYKDVLDAPEGLVAEVLAGELYTHPRPAGPHAEAASVLGMDLGGAFHRGRGGPGGWLIPDEPGQREPTGGAPAADRPERVGGVRRPAVGCG